MSSRSLVAEGARALTAAGLLLAGVAACGGGPDAGPSFLYVRGVVTAADGSAVPLAQIRLEVRRPGETAPIGQETTASDATGAYGVLLAIFLPPFEGLLDVHVTPRDTAVLRPASVRDRPVRFNPADSRDTVRVNVVVSPP